MLEHSTLSGCGSSSWAREVFRPLELSPLSSESFPEALLSRPLEELPVARPLSSTEKLTRHSRERVLPQSSGLRGTRRLGCSRGCCLCSWCCGWLGAVSSTSLSVSSVHHCWPVSSATIKRDTNTHAITKSPALRLITCNWVQTKLVYKQSLRVGSPHLGVDAQSKLDEGAW
jgi:hypothetical protein